VPSPVSEGALLDERAAAFLHRPGVSITAASRDEQNVPRIGRCLGCRVAAERQKVTVFVALSQYKAFFDALAASRAIAVVFSLPSTHRTLQLKGSDAAIERLAPGDAEIVVRHVDNFVDELAALGYPREVVRACHWCEATEVRAVTFTPTAAFEQTPGPDAGAPLPRSA
jgi:hypothetical protein